MAEVAGTHGQHVTKALKSTSITFTTHGGHYAFTTAHPYINLTLSNQGRKSSQPGEVQVMYGPKTFAKLVLLGMTMWVPMVSCGFPWCHVGPQGVHVGPDGFNGQSAWFASLEDTTMENLQLLAAAVVLSHTLGTTRPHVMIAVVHRLAVPTPLSNVDNLHKLLIRHWSVIRYGV